MGPEEREEDDRVIQSGIIAQGPEVAKFEEEFAEMCGVKYAVATNNGTTSGHLAMLANDIGPGDEVITTPFTFFATASVIMMAGAKPVFVDVEDDGFCLDPKKVEAAITNKTKAIQPVHLYGELADMPSFLEICKKHNLILIEDCCEAHGATYKGKKVGSRGDVGCFSFYPTKNMTVAGDGGMTTTDNEEIALKIKSIRDNGRKTKTEFDKLGFTMRLNTVNAAIGRVQLKHLDEKNTRRREIVSIYRKNLANDCILPENENGKSVYHQIVIKHEKRDQIRQELTDNDIGSAIYYETPIHLQPIYQKYGYKLPNSEKFSKEIMSLPSYPSLTDDQLLVTCEHVNKIIS